MYLWAPILIKLENLPPRNGDPCSNTSLLHDDVSKEPFSGAAYVFEVSLLVPPRTCLFFAAWALKSLTALLNKVTVKIPPSGSSSTLLQHKHTVLPTSDHNDGRKQCSFWPCLGFHHKTLKGMGQLFEQWCQATVNQVRVRATHLYLHDRRNVPSAAQRL